MWHKGETNEPEISLNVSLMGCQKHKHRTASASVVGSDEGWRKIVTFRPGGGEDAITDHLDSMMSRLPEMISEFVKKGSTKDFLCKSKSKSKSKSRNKQTKTQTQKRLKGGNDVIFLRKILCVFEHDDDKQQTKDSWLLCPAPISIWRRGLCL